MRELKKSDIIKESTNFYEIIKALSEGKEIIAKDMSFGYYLRSDRVLMYQNRVVNMEATEFRIVKNVPFYICHPVKQWGYLQCKNVDCQVCPIKWICKNTLKSQAISKTEMCLYNVLDIITKDAPEELRDMYLKLLDKEV